MLKHWMHKWEQSLSTKDTNRVTLPFEWGFDFLNHGFVPDENPKESILRFNRITLDSSNEFFQHTSSSYYRFEEDRLTFPSSIQTRYPENNTVFCRVFSTEKKNRAVVVLPQWNADPAGHVGLCKMLQKFGITALRLTLPYHEQRNPSGPRADFLVSPNIGRTIQAIQQSVLDARNAVDWLSSQGYKRIGIMGTSVGSCISFLAYLHDPRIGVGVFNHVSSLFGDVVWDGISTRHVRKGVESALSKEELREAWAVISPNSFVSRLRDSAEKKRLYLTAKYDLTFPPDLSQLLFEEHKRWNIPYEVAYLPCGHYTSALAPFKYIVGYHIANYFLKNL